MKSLLSELSLWISPAVGVLGIVSVIVLIAWMLYRFWTLIA